MTKIYDCTIIGGGFAGISAALYLSRFRRSVLVVDNDNGRWNTHEFNENYLGFPNGISAKELRNRGVKQAERFGSIFLQDTIIDVKKNKKIFICKGLSSTYQSRTLIFATGVIDNFPHFAAWRDYVGKTLFWCITCDGYKTIGKRLVVTGNTDDAVNDAMQFLQFTKKITFITNSPPGTEKISEIWIKRLKQAKIPYVRSTIQQYTGKNGIFEKITLADGRVIYFDYLFNEKEATPQSELTRKLGLSIDKKGYILADTEQRTNIPFIYAAGDITEEFSHQIVTAAHEGSMAAQSVNYDLYTPEQKSL